MTDAKLTTRFRDRLDRLLDLFRRELRNVLNVSTVIVPTNDGFPPTIGAALDRVATDADAYCKATADHLLGLVGLVVAPEYRHDVLAPGRRVAERWHWPVELKHTTLLSMCAGLCPVTDADSIQARKRLLDALNPPVEYNPVEIAKRLKDALNDASPGAGNEVLQWAKHKRSWPLSGTTAHRDGRRAEVRCLPEHLALLGRAVEDVKAVTPTPFSVVLLPVNQATVSVTTSLLGADPTKFNKPGTWETESPTNPADPVELVFRFADNAQLKLPFYKEGLSPLLAVQRQYGHAAVRDLIALLALAWADRKTTDEQFWWWVDEHLRFTGRNPTKENRQQMRRWLKEMEGTWLEARYRRGAALTGKLVNVVRQEKGKGAFLLLPHDALYRGIVDREAPYWWPVPTELLRLPANRTAGPVYGLAVVFGQLWRTRLGKPGPTTGRIGAKLLADKLGVRGRAADSTRRKRDTRAADTLRRGLESGKDCGLIDHWTVDGDLDSLSGTVSATPGEMALEVQRTRQLVRPAWLPATGEELDTWIAMGGGNAEAARHLEVRPARLRQVVTEYTGRPLPKPIREALWNYLWGVPHCEPHQ